MSTISHNQSNKLHKIIIKNYKFRSIIRVKYENERKDRSSEAFKFSTEAKMKMEIKQEKICAI